LYWTSPSVFLAGNYFRSSKNGVALTGAILFLLLHQFLNAEDSKPQKQISQYTWLTVCGISWVSTLFDRQGYYFVGMIILFVLFWNLALPHTNNIIMLIAFGASLCLGLIYNHLIAPFLTESLNHYRPNFS